MAPDLNIYVRQQGGPVYGPYLKQGTAWSKMAELSHNSRHHGTPLEIRAWRFDPSMAYKYKPMDIVNFSRWLTQDIQRDEARITY